MSEAADTAEVTVVNEQLSNKDESGCANKEEVTVEVEPNTSGEKRKESSSSNEDTDVGSNPKYAETTFADNASDAGIRIATNKDDDELAKYEGRTEVEGAPSDCKTSCYSYRIEIIVGILVLILLIIVIVLLSTTLYGREANNATSNKTTTASSVSKTTLQHVPTTLPSTKETTTLTPNPVVTALPIETTLPPEATKLLMTLATTEQSSTRASLLTKLTTATQTPTTEATSTVINGTGTAEPSSIPATAVATQNITTS